VSELSTAQDDMKTLRQVIDQMAREYEAAKDVDVFRRYVMLKRTVKRTVMHLRLHQTSSCDDPNAATGVVKARSKEEQRKRIDYINSMCLLGAVLSSTQIHVTHEILPLGRCIRYDTEVERGLTRKPSYR